MMRKTKLLKTATLMCKLRWSQMCRVHSLAKSQFMRNKDCSATNPGHKGFTPVFKDAQINLSTLKPSAVNDLWSDIDLDRINTGCTTEAQCKQLADSVKKEMEQRLDDAIHGLSGADLKLFKVIQLEHSFLYSEGYAIPPPGALTSRNWLDAMTLTSMEERLLYYSNLERMAVGQRAEPREEVQSKADGDGENCHSIYLNCLRQNQEERAGNQRLLSAMQHGSVLVVDLGYPAEYLSTELDPLVHQLWKLYMVNRQHRDPFHLVFTNTDFSGPLYRHFLLTCLVRTQFVLATFTEKSHVDLFQHRDLVYLSTQAKTSLQVVRPDTVYILGAYSDPMVRRKLSFPKAQEERIKSCKLPIDQHVKWAHQAHKDLDLQHVTGILLSVRQDRLWKKAFESVIPHLVAPKNK